MLMFYPDIERGTSATLTQRKHIPSYIFKSAAKLEKMQSEIEEVLKNTNFANASKNTKKAIKMIENWVPMAETFETKVNMLSKSLQAEQKGNMALREAYNAESDKADSRLFELIKLRNQVEALQKLYAKVPEEIRKEIEAKKRSKEAQR